MSASSDRPILVERPLQKAEALFVRGLGQSRQADAGPRARGYGQLANAEVSAIAAAGVPGALR